MQIMQKSIHIIDYESGTVVQRNTPQTFDAYVNELISHIHSNDSVREYKTRSNMTEVIRSILSLYSATSNVRRRYSLMGGIASRLMRKEVEAQERIERTQTNVQKGSLIQALLFDKKSDGHIYLLSKVEHTEWVDDVDFTFKTGFSKNKKTMWKSCLFDLSDSNAATFQAKIYSNTVAKYWSEDFLELDEQTNDEINTSRAFKAIEVVMNQNFRNTSSPDHTILRNTLIGYLRKHDHIDFPLMIEEIFGSYQPVDQEIHSDKIQNIKNKLLELPIKKNFDCQFNAVPGALNARIKKIYAINDGIHLKISTGIENLQETIQAIEKNGKRYIQIRTNNNDTFNRFRTNGAI